MTAVESILIITGTPGFGELIQQSLDETGKYKSLLVASTKEALSWAQTMPFSLAILDSDLEGENLTEVAQELKRTQENLCLVIIPPENDPDHPDLAQISMDGYLTKPFYLPDLLDTVAEVLSSKSDQSASSPLGGSKLSAAFGSKATESPLEWLKDVSRAAQHLTRLSLESSAQAALIVRQGELWAYAGQLNQPAAQEVAAAVVRFWTDSRPPRGAKYARSVDMVRVVRLNTTDSDYILYVTSLGREMVLALAFDAETPFSTIRAQANFLSRSLSSPSENKAQITSFPTNTQLSIRQPQVSFTSTPSATADESVEDVLDGLENDLPPVNLMPLLDNVPPPDPRRRNPRINNSGQRKNLSSLETTGVVQPMQAEQGIDTQVEKSLTTRLESPQLPNESQHATITKLDEYDEEHHSSEQLLITEAGNEIVEEKLRPITPALHSLYYVCLLIPRFPQHHLTGDLAITLSEMLGRLCLAYGWRLEYIALRPDYMQWIANVPPATPPSYLMRIIRQKTSEHIFESFPKIRKENPSGDFWAPGYLLMSGSQLPTAHVVKEFIQQTRQQQGITTPSHPKV